MSTAPVTFSDCLAEGGVMAREISMRDWSASPLGPIDAWPQSLRMVVSLCVASNLPINVIWGPQHTQIYNDSYRHICGAKTALGKNYTLSWASTWSTLDAIFTRALAGQTSFLENTRMFLDRNGYLEEAFLTFSLIPIHDESGGIGGLFHQVTETTSQMLTQRRMRALRDLAATGVNATTMADACEICIRALAEDAPDLPFLLLYLANPEKTEFHLAGHAHLAAGTAASPLAIAAAHGQRTWPIEETLASHASTYLGDIVERFGELNCGPYPESPHTAFIAPIYLPGSEFPAGVLIAGVSPRLPLDEAYRTFFDLTVAGVTTVMLSARGREDERGREVEKKLRTSIGELEEFAFVASNDLQEPLRMVSLYTQLLLHRHIDAHNVEAREFASFVKEGANRMVRLLRDLASYARVIHDEEWKDGAETDLSVPLSAALSLLAPQIEASSAEITFTALPRVRGDETRLVQVFQNLIENSLLYRAPGMVPTIHIAAERKNEEWILSIRDNGIGFDPRFADRIFGLFKRLHKEAYSGTGVGLTICRHIVERCGGRIWAESTLGNGATFYFTLLAADNK
jgi:signal transduction histidine kinase